MCKLQEQAMERAGEVDFRTDVEKEMGGAAVRGEAVAGHDAHFARLALIRASGDEELIEAVKIGRVSISAAVRQVVGATPREMAIAQAVRQACVNTYSPDSSAHDWSEAMADINLSNVIRSVSARAADAPSEPSVPEAYQWRHRHAEHMPWADWQQCDMEQYDQVIERKRQSQALENAVELDQVRALVVAADALDSQPTELPEECSDEMYRETTHICNLLEREDVNAMWRAMRKVAIDSRASSAPAAPIAPDADLAQARRSIAYIRRHVDESKNSHLWVLIDDDIETVSKYLAAPQQEGSEAGNG
jgi:hypothetical protein